MTRRSDSSAPQVPAWFFLAMLSITMLTALGFLHLGKSMAPGSNLPVEELKILSRAFERIDENYVYELSDERRSELMHAAVSGMVRKLDIYSRYFPPTKRDAYNIGTLGVMTGIGVTVEDVDEAVVVLYPIPKGPAEVAGLQVGDVIRAVDGKPVAKTADAIEHIRGEAGTATRLTIQRGTQPTIEVQIERDSILIPSVRWARILDPDRGIGYAYLAKFTRNSATELDLTLQQLDSALGEGRRLSGLVLDLRQNPGGLLDTCLEITNRFIGSGKLLTLKRRKGDDIVHEATPEKCTRPDLRLVLILDSDSASASEVLAGALQDHGRARVVGTRSFGKGVVQSVFSWQKTLEQVKITTSVYLTPKGRRLESHLRPEDEEHVGGIQPDRKVEFGKSATARKVAFRLSRREVPQKYRVAVDELAARHTEIQVYRPVAIEDDVQLAAALEEVRTSLLTKAGAKTGASVK